MTNKTIQVLPLYLNVDDVVVEVLEVLEHKIDGQLLCYTVSMRLRYKGIKSKVFAIDCKNMGDLINKIKVEISKLKLFEIVMGFPELRRIIT